MQAMAAAIAQADAVAQQLLAEEEAAAAQAVARSVGKPGKKGKLKLQASDITLLCDADLEAVQMQCMSPSAHQQ